MSIAPYDGAFFEVPYDAAAILGNDGAGAQLRYADYGLWTGEPLPTSTSCPSFTGFTACGPGCGACPGDRICTGRSPLHPQGFCIPKDTGICDGSGDVNYYGFCFTFTVQAEAQTIADKNGYFLSSSDECAALAAQLPGGGKCP